ncbi:MAG: carbohydrate ABC transporter permease [Defluviitaleaceae bacterium]|nr:carbohydrate ABC transporter permease [Defluviitaleaceae bacterium]MCL2835916.1 carbohydrate ABC transporter permease [Defluviitaleaceae bacterium]
MKRLDASEVIFRAFAYTLLTIFALFCLYPFVYAISAAISGRVAYYSGDVVLFPVDVQFDAFREIVLTKRFWISYANTLHVTFYGTIWALGTSVLGAYALSKKRLVFRRGFNFFLVFTLWFNAGLVPQFLNYRATQNIFESFFNITDDKWLVVFAMGMAAFNVILLRNAFEAVPYEIEEAAVVDGATEFQLLTRVYIPMSKAAIATVGLFFGISRWNGYFWARTMIRNRNEWPLQVYIRDTLEAIMQREIPVDTTYAQNSLIYAMIVCAIIPIIIIYPYIQKYFAKGVNVGGVKE